MPSRVRRCPSSAPSRGYATAWNLRHVVRVHGADCNGSVIRSIAVDELRRQRVYFGVAGSPRLESTLPIASSVKVVHGVAKLEVTVRRSRRPFRAQSVGLLSSPRGRPNRGAQRERRGTGPRGQPFGHVDVTTSRLTASAVDGQTADTSQGSAVDRSLGGFSSFWGELDAIMGTLGATSSPICTGLDIDFGDTLLAAADDTLVTPCPVRMLTPERACPPAPLDLSAAILPISIADLPPVGQNRFPSAVEAVRISAIPVLLAETKPRVRGPQHLGRVNG